MFSVFTLGRHRCRRVLSSFHASACPSACSSVCLFVRPEGRYHPNTLRLSAVALKFGRWCTLSWCRSHFKIASFGVINRASNFFHDRLWPRRWLVSVNVRKSHYSLTFGNTMQCTTKQIIMSNGHTQPKFAFDLGRPRRLLFSERLWQWIGVI